MFGFFKKQVHEPIELQRKDVLSLQSPIVDKILAGEYCDEISGGYGEFGSKTNPIPVNGSIGELKYLGKLRGLSGNALLFHRIGSVDCPVLEHSADLYEVVCIDGTQRGYLHFDMYHPKRSDKAPSGYTLTPFNKKLGMDIPYAYGVNSFVDNFPFSLPEAVVNLYGKNPGEAFSRKITDILKRGDFQKNDKSRKKSANDLPNSVKEYRLNGLLYNIDWTRYNELIQYDFAALIEVYIFRVWIYNYTFRRVSSEYDPVVNEMLTVLINELREYGHADFLEDNADMDEEQSINLSKSIQEAMLSIFEEYDAIVQKYINDKLDIEMVGECFKSRISSRLGEESISISKEDLSRLMIMCIQDIHETAATIAESKMRNQLNL